MHQYWNVLGKYCGQTNSKIRNLTRKCERHARFQKRRKKDVEHRDRETWQNIRNEKIQSLQLRIQQSKRYFRKILFQLILLLSFQHFYSLFTSNQLQVAYAWSIQQLLSSRTRARASSFLPIFTMFRDLSRALLLQPREYQSWRETVYYLYYRLLFRKISEEERNLGGTIEKQLYSGLFGIIRRRKQLFFLQIQETGQW